MKQYFAETTNYYGVVETVEVSKEVYHEMQDNDRYIDSQERQQRRRCVHFDSVSWDNLELLATASLEDEYFGDIDCLEQQRRKREAVEKIYAILNTCTQKQRERFLMYVVDGLAQREIAQLEKVNLSKIQKSIEQVLKKLKKVFENPEK